uniref:SecY-independent transporter protein n=1 Tax=Sporochnus bolleanus TaxID=461143 RepID=UPI002E776117|nr:SecY-independent transporter protein [Sporochnus bolleanus]WBP70328.1 SecY-independent transporter protein [Sporochnus bolleanus]
MRRLQFSMYYLRELNYRLAYAGFGTVILFFTTYIYKQPLIFLFLPKGLSHFVSTGLTEIFFTYLQLCILLSLGFSLGLILIQLYLFLRPGLYAFEASTSLNLLIIIICFYLCIYIFVFPILVQLLWKLFSSYSHDFTPIHLTFELRINDYLEQLNNLSKILSLSLPYFLGLNIIQNYTARTTWIRYRSISYLISFSIAAFITPPDIISQFIVGVPLIIFFEIQILYWALYKRYQEQLLTGKPIKTYNKTNRKKKQG